MVSEVSELYKEILASIQKYLGTEKSGGNPISLAMRAKSFKIENKKLTCDELCVQMQEWNFEEYVALFRSNKIDLQYALSLTSKDWEELVPNKFHRGNLKMKITQLP